MKLRISIITAVLLLASLFIIPLQAQGLYSSNKDTQSNNSSTPSHSIASEDDKNGVYYAPGDPNENNDQDGQEAGQDSGESPIGGGFLFLSLLSGGYALLKYRNRKEK